MTERARARLYGAELGAVDVGAKLGAERATTEAPARMAVLHLGVMTHGAEMCYERYGLWCRSLIKNIIYFFKDLNIKIVRKKG